MLTMSKNEVFENVISCCKDLLFNFPEAESYKEYVLSRISKQTVEKFNIGYFPQSSFLNLLLRKVNSKDLEKYNLLLKRSNFTFSYFEDNNLIIPYYDIAGKPIALIGRSLLSDKERKQKNIIKYKNTIFKKGNYLFNLHNAKDEILKQGFVYIVEGQFDVIKCYEKGIYNVVATSTSSLSTYQLSSLLRYTDNIFVLFDNDEAGEKGRHRIDSKYKDVATFSHVRIPRGYKDADEYLNKNNDLCLEMPY